MQESHQSLKCMFKGSILRQCILQLDNETQKLQKGLMRTYYCPGMCNKLPFSGGLLCHQRLSSFLGSFICMKTNFGKAEKLSSKIFESTFGHAFFLFSLHGFGNEDVSAKSAHTITQICITMYSFHCICLRRRVHAELRAG